LTFIARGPSLEALRARGLTVRSPSVGNFTVPVHATDDPEELDPPDLILFCVKSYDLEQAAEQIRPLVGPGTAVLPLLNGIDATARLGRIVGEGAVLVGISYARSTRTAPATIDHMANIKITLGEPTGGLSRRVEAVAALAEPGPRDRAAPGQDVLDPVEPERAVRQAVRQRLDLDEVPIAAPEPALDLLAVNEALERFERVDPLKARLVKLRYFAGLTIPQAADALGISSTTADRYWSYARAWLHAELSKDGAGRLP